VVPPPPPPPPPGARGGRAPPPPPLASRAPPQPAPPLALAAALAFTTHIDTIRYTTHNSSKFGAGAQTAAPGSRSTLDPPDPGIGIAASASMPLSA